MSEKEVLKTNQRFYDAFNKNDIELMIGVWLNDPISQCIHPGWDVLIGFKNIMTSWQKIFAAAQDLEIKLSHVDVTASENIAWVTCQENLFSIVSSGVQLSKVHSTNLFKMMNGEWKMILHHASPVSGLPAAEEQSSQ
ncbi:MAG: nuclear transport factor 2 family protein [Gammaproteobacteria bacterium]|nr:nuclear transport factor 2 family protein [Gammaproteobacteria bacterium]